MWYIRKRLSWSEGGHESDSYDWSTMNGEVALETDYPVLATRRKSLYNLVAAGTRTALQYRTVLPTAGLSKEDFSLTRNVWRGCGCGGGGGGGGGRSQRLIDR